jgi:hypothetical protein
MTIGRSRHTAAMSDRRHGKEKFPENSRRFLTRRQQRDRRYMPFDRPPTALEPPFGRPATASRPPGGLFVKTRETPPDRDAALVSGRVAR